MVPFASRSISVSISGRAASIRAIVRRQSEVWYELSKIFVRAAVEMLFGANFPHPTFVDQAIGTHRQSGIQLCPDASFLFLGKEKAAGFL